MPGVVLRRPADAWAPGLCTALLASYHFKWVFAKSWGNKEYSILGHTLGSTLGPPTYAIYQELASSDLVCAN